MDIANQHKGFALQQKKTAVLSKRWMVNLVSILSFFPFIAFIPGMQTEVQPYCYLFAFCFIFLFKAKLPYRFYLFIFLCLLYAFVFFSAELYLDLNLVIKSIPHLIIYLGPPVFFWVVFRNFKKISLKIVHNIFYVWVGVGFLQQFFPSIFSAIGLKRILEVLIPRFNVESLSQFGDRGVTSLSNEPSYAGIVIFTLFLVVIYRRILNEISARVFLFNVAIYLAALVYNASVTMFILTLLLVMAYVYQTRKYLLAFSLLCLFLLPFFIFDFTFRIVDLIMIFPDLLEASDWNPYYVMIGPLGSHREFSTYVGMRSAFSHFWGNGYYSSLTSFIDVAKGMNVDLTRAFFFDYTYDGYYVNMKPYGYGALVLFELGVIPFLLINSILITVLIRARKMAHQFRRFGMFLAIGILLLLNFNTPASLPSYWFALVVALFIIRARTGIVKQTEAENE